MTHIPDEVVEELRAALFAERDSLTEELSARGKQNPETGDWQGASTSKGEEADPTDAADNIEELATNVQMVEELERRLTDVNDAIARMENGTYGICERDGSPIPVERLEANPAARTNI